MFEAGKAGGSTSASSAVAIKSSASATRRASRTSCSRSCRVDTSSAKSPSKAFSFESPRTAASLLVRMTAPACVRHPRWHRCSDPRQSGGRRRHDQVPLPREPGLAFSPARDRLPDRPELVRTPRSRTVTSAKLASRFARLVAGELKWHHIEDNDKNRWADYGYHKYQISRSYRPIRPSTSSRSCIGVPAVAGPGIVRDRGDHQLAGIHRLRAVSAVVEYFKHRLFGACARFL